MAKALALCWQRRYSPAQTILAWLLSLGIGKDGNGDSHLVNA